MTQAYMVVRPLVRTRINDRTLRPGDTLRVSGIVRPRQKARGKSVELQMNAFPLTGGCNCGSSDSR